MRTMKRSLAMAVTAVAVAGISFAGVAPASAAPVGNAAASGRNCDDYATQAAKHQQAGDEYTALGKAEAAKSSPDRAKVARYYAMAQDEYQQAAKFKDLFDSCTGQ
ncbi:hypothetical protein [Streptomyces gilvosporeus]|uniref:Uncharacterized protein n=1 Tax=Streptomyces gilvosporeus TaxID=553510 RepID=A0A1V0TWJ6_9ACTN|nr:hypothetical protein [Streptomyces gilvosporeus]ARF57200.1 hypothetical protein B1H19_26230 [Streptomyces gilvosporeus]